MDAYELDMLSAIHGVVLGDDYRTRAPSRSRHVGHHNVRVSIFHGPLYVANKIFKSTS